METRSRPPQSRWVDHSGVVPPPFQLTYGVKQHFVAMEQRHDIVQLTSTIVTRPDLRSSSNTASYVTPHLRTKFGEHAFSFAGPASWNSLPVELRSVSDSTDFNNKLKTYLFICDNDDDDRPSPILSVSIDVD